MTPVANAWPECVTSIVKCIKNMTYRFNEK